MTNNTLPLWQVFSGFVDRAAGSWHRITVGQDLPPDVQVVAADDHAYLLVGEAALGEHGDEVFSVMAYGLRFGAAEGSSIEVWTL